MAGQGHYPAPARCGPQLARPPPGHEEFVCRLAAGQVPLWFDLAREFTERRVHYRQIQDAARPAGHDHPADEYLPLVLRTFIWGFPHQYRTPAPAGTAIALEIPGRRTMFRADLAADHSSFPIGGGGFSRRG
ncbi:MAG: hypothetical protein ABSB76_20425 [Streptosporangiaceae bacterium]